MVVDPGMVVVVESGIVVVLELGTVVVVESTAVVVVPEPTDVEVLSGTLVVEESSKVVVVDSTIVVLVVVVPVSSTAANAGAGISSAVTAREAIQARPFGGFLAARDGAPGGAMSLEKPTDRSS